MRSCRPYSDQRDRRPLHEPWRRRPLPRPGRLLHVVVTPAYRSRRREGLEISPNLWAGYGLVRGGAGTALVGSHEQVAERIEEYHALGLDHFILSGQPHLEEAYWFGEGVRPLLAARGLLADVLIHPAAVS